MGNYTSCNTWSCCKKDGTKVDIKIGEDENDPVLGISDLLIHLSADQLDKKELK